MLIFQLGYGIVDPLSILENNSYDVFKGLKITTTENFPGLRAAVVFCDADWRYRRRSFDHALSGLPRWGNFTDISTGIELELAESDSYGLIVGKDSNTSDQLEFIYSLQPTNLKANGAVSPVVLVDVDVENFLVAGKKVLNKNSGTFVSGLVGVTRFDPGSSSLNPETRFALGVGGGVDYRISKQVGFRLEGRGIATFLDSNGAVLCGSNGGCLVFAESNLLWQFEFVTGFTIRF